MCALSLTIWPLPAWHYEGIRVTDSWSRTGNPRSLVGIGRREAQETQDRKRAC